MRCRNPILANALASSSPQVAMQAKLTYFGGPVISRVNVVPIYYGNITNAQQIQTFYKDITSSTYFDMLKEYSTPTQNITRGTTSNGIRITSNIKTNVDDEKDIQSILKNLISRKIINPTPNTYYPIHFPPNIDITFRGYKSCQDFCGYHGTIDLGAGKLLYYGVIAAGGECCLTDRPKFERLTFVATHELFEAVTDPAASLVTSLGAPLSWYDADIGGEMTDLCNPNYAYVKPAKTQYAVSMQFSNKRQACVVD